MAQASEIMDGEAVSGDVCRAVVHTFDELRARGISSDSALQAATRVFTYHEPKVRRGLAVAIVQSLAIERTGPSPAGDVDQRRT